MIKKRLVMIKNFFKGLFNENGSVSSKRVYALMVLLMLFLMAVANQLFAKPLDMAVFATFATMFLTLMGYAVYAQTKSIEAKSSVASDMVNSTADNEAAKETLQDNEVK